MPNQIIMILQYFYKNMILDYPQACAGYHLTKLTVSWHLMNLCLYCGCCKETFIKQKVVECSVDKCILSGPNFIIL